MSIDITIQKLEQYKNDVLNYKLVTSDQYKKIYAKAFLLDVFTRLNLLSGILSLGVFVMGILSLLVYLMIAPSTVGIADYKYSVIGLVVLGMIAFVCIKLSSFFESKIDAIYEKMVYTL